MQVDQEKLKLLQEQREQMAIRVKNAEETAAQAITLSRNLASQLFEIDRQIELTRQGQLDFELETNDVA